MLLTESKLRKIIAEEYAKLLENEDFKPQKLSKEEKLNSAIRYLNKYLNGQSKTDPLRASPSTFRGAVGSFTPENLKMFLNDNYPEQSEILFNKLNQFAKRPKPVQIPQDDGEPAAPEHFRALNKY